MEVIEGGFGKNDLTAALESFKKDIDSYIELAQLTAQLQKIKYDALILEGFTPEQAIVLCEKIF